MIALPCGHQFCKKDIERVGFKPGQASSQNVMLSPRSIIDLSEEMMIDLTHCDEVIVIE